MIAICFFFYMFCFVFILCSICITLFSRDKCVLFECDERKKICMVCSSSSSVCLIAKYSLYIKYIMFFSYKSGVFFSLLSSHSVLFVVVVVFVIVNIYIKVYVVC